MENLVLFRDRFRGRTVWVSGHTGFKGAWLCEWLLALGAKVHGYALPPPTTPALFNQLALTERIEHEIGDVRDSATVQRSLHRVQPDFVFHLAAQPLVRHSYAQPVETYAVNVMGTVHVLEALRTLQKPCAAILITTDKCYENREWTYGYRENDPLGGYDPYSSSKSAAEIAMAAYRRSFFRDHPVSIASVRAGNVIGGGDWALDRIVPDSIRALQAGTPIPVRNRIATRPWQHVLDPLSGYLSLAAHLTSDLRPLTSDLASAFNFGPTHEANRTVAELVQEILKHGKPHYPARRRIRLCRCGTRLREAAERARDCRYVQARRPDVGSGYATDPANPNATVSTTAFSGARCRQSNPGSHG